MSVATTTPLAVNTTLTMLPEPALALAEIVCGVPAVTVLPAEGVTSVTVGPVPATTVTFVAAEVAWTPR